MNRQTGGSSPCDGLIEYMLGEGTEVERKRFERHLEECPSCRADAAVWEETWGELHEDVEWVEPPADLKLQVMNALYEADRERREPAETGGTADVRPQHQEGIRRKTSNPTEAMGADTRPPKLGRLRRKTSKPTEGLGTDTRPDEMSRLRRKTLNQTEGLGASPSALVKRRLRIWSLAAVALVLVFAAGWWGGTANRGRPADSLAALPPTDRIESLFHLVADRSNGMLSENPRAYGIACIVSSSSDRPKQLIVYLFGAPRTDGDEAYQVWLWNDGSRRSAGSLKVEGSGIGILTATLAEDAPPIQSIGVTLEPSGPSTTPKGQKVFGSSPDDPAWSV